MLALHFEELRIINGTRDEMKDFQNCRHFQKKHSILDGGLISCDVYGNILDTHCIELCQGTPKEKIMNIKKLIKRIKKLINKILLFDRPLLAYRSPPYFQDTEAWKIILAENEQLKRDKDFLEKERQAGITKIWELERERKMPRYIGLQDRNGYDIYAGCTFKCKIRCSGNKELTGIIKWGKFKAGYILQELNGDSTIAAFRSPAGFGVEEIKELPDGRIDGVVIEDNKCEH